LLMPSKKKLQIVGFRRFDIHSQQSWEKSMPTTP